MDLFELDLDDLVRSVGVPSSLEGLGENQLREVDSDMRLDVD